MLYLGTCERQRGYRLRKAEGPAFQGQPAVRPYNDSTERFRTAPAMIRTHGMFDATYASQILDLDNLLAKRLVADLRVGLNARVLAIAL